MIDQRLSPRKDGLRVCHVNDMGWQAGGAERSIQTLRRELTERGHVVQVVATDKDAANRTDLFADVLIPHITGGAVRRFLRYFFYRNAYRELRRIFADFRPDVVHFHTIGELSPAALFAAAGIPFVVTVHGPEDFTIGLMPWHLPPSDYRNRTYRRSDLRLIGYLRFLYLSLVQRPAYLFALRRCRAVVAPSEFLARVLQRDVDPRRVVQIYNGIELPAATAAPGEGRFLFVGRLEAVKGVDVLLRAFAAARAVCPGITVTIAGDGSQRDALEQLAVELGVAADVRFLGRVGPDDVLHALNDCDALVAPSVWPEAFGLVVVEAMGVGRAVIGSRVGAIPELVADGVSGILVDPYDQQALADGMVRLASDRQLCTRLGEAGRHRATAFSAELFADRTLDLYERTAALPRPTCDKDLERL